MEVLKTLVAVVILFEFFAFGIIVVWNLFSNIKSGQMKEVVNYGLVFLFVRLIIDFLDDIKSLEEEVLTVSATVINYSLWDYIRYSLVLIVVSTICVYISYSIYCEIRQIVIRKHLTGESS
jgi:hypothetical protein